MILPILVALGILLGLCAPIIITVLNIARVIRAALSKKTLQGKRETALFCMDLYAMIGGALWSWFAHSLIAGGDWYVAINIRNIPFHFPIASEYFLTFFVPAILSILALFLMRRPSKYPPMVTVAMYAFVYIGMALSIVWMIQLWENIDRFEVIFLFLYPVNYLLLSLIYLKYSIARFNADRRVKVGNFIYKACHSWAWCFVLLIPICGILVMILALFGQRPDAIIRAFTETADWTFSQRIPPPPLDHTGHYLCTVAANGHKSIVRPILIGKRHGKPIVVNRQLQIANAFEELVAEKAPQIHRRIRHTYDKYGYPFSRHIITPLRSSFVYIAMKPFEWFFLLVLYTFDCTPENRIQKQYVQPCTPTK